MKKLFVLFGALLVVLFTNSCQEPIEQDTLLLESEVVYFAEYINLSNQRIMADFEAVPRRCRVVKRYRPKGEVYRVSVDVANPANAAFAVVDFGEPLFTGKNPSFNQLIENQNLKMVPVKQGNGKGGKKDASLELEFSSEEFLFKADKNNQTLKFTVTLVDVKGNDLNSQTYQVTIGPESKKPTEILADEVKGFEPSIDVKSAVFLLGKSEIPGVFSLATELTFLADGPSSEYISKSAKKVAYTILSVNGKGGFSSDKLVFDINQIKQENLRVLTNFAILLGGSNSSDSRYSGDPEVSSKVILELLDDAGKPLEFKKGITALTLEVKHQLR
jgi:hypothetical protein